jgi:hypothetical protein
MPVFGRIPFSFPDVQAPSVTVLHPASDEVTCGRRYRNGSDQNSYIDRDW